ncbi:hypothetical protein ACNTMW_23645 [Planosporangium sp. 12N6]|uniref:hypothetical protein n=1 Tax=Planosporangium spinosum TaxID=3402278 RepID=UPI003CF6A17E
MHRRLAYLLAWSVAAAITVSVAWLGIRSVLAAAAPTRTVPLATAQLRRVAPVTPPDRSAPQVSGSTSTSGSARPSADSSASPSSAGWQATGGGGFRRSFHTAGGDATFFTTKDAVQVESSNPNAGYTVNVTRYATDSVMVSFFGNRKTSRVWVRWWNGPYGEVTESVD